MKKITFKIFMIMCLLGTYTVVSQTLNQPANWPNASWTLSGTFNQARLLGDPSVDSTFGFDDSAAGVGSTNNIIATSPVIDLTATSDAGEHFINVSGTFVYYAFQGDVLAIEVYDADASTWSTLKTFAGNTTTRSDYQTCANTKVYTTATFDISGYSATQLSGFQYRMSYDDNAKMQYGFCLTSPTITSFSCADPSTLTAINLTATTADLGWTESGTAILWDVEVVTNGTAATGTPTAAGVTNPYTATGLAGNTTYDFYVRASCNSGGNSSWAGPFKFKTLCPTFFTAPYTEDFSAFTTGNSAFKTGECWTGIRDRPYPWISSSATRNRTNPNTGPSASITTGNYFYTNSMDGTEGNTTDLVSPNVDLTALTYPSLTFNYYMYGAEMGTLDVLVNGNINVFTLTGEQQATDTTPWKLAVIDLSAYANQTISITFRVTRGSGFDSDVAIDNVKFNEFPTTVTTTVASAIAVSSATLGGNATSDGGNAITERGIVYSTSDTTPTIAEGATKDANGDGTGVFSKSITGLSAGTLYYFNAYIINSIGTSYGTATSFTTTRKSWIGATDTDWATPSNWNSTSIPIASDNLVIPNVGNKPIILSGTSALANNITIDAATSLTINTGGSLTMDGNLTQNGIFTINSDATTNGSLIVKGTSVGNVTYKRYLTTSAAPTEGWHLIGAPVNGQSINAFSSSFLTSTSGTNNKSIAPYVNNVVTTSRWRYYTTADGTNDIASAGNFVKAKGYSVKIGTAGTLDFTGTLYTSDESISITDGGDDPAGNRWNLIANPYTAALKVGNSVPGNQTNTFLKVNINNLDPVRAGLALWNGTAYVEKSVDDDFFIAPGQAFFVNAPDAATGKFANFTEAMQTHQTGNIFLRSGTGYPEIILHLADDTSNASTKIRYIETKTTGLDPGSDVGTFTGTSSNFKIFTHLVSNSDGVDFAIQALPNSNYENMVVPVGVYAAAGKEITFSLEASNFTSDMKLYLEDRLTNTFTRLDEGDSSYKITLNEALNGIGRFYLHTTKSALSVANNLALENISLYKVDKTTLRITGLNKSDASIKLFTLLGKQVMKSSFNSNGIKDISLPKLAKGVYIIQLKTDKGTLNKKIILE